MKNDNESAGPQKPVKPTNAELAQRIEEVAALLARGRTRSEIHREAEAKWGTAWRTTDRYVVRAREKALEAIGQDKRSLIAEAFSTYRGILADPSASPLARIKAQDSIVDLLGLKATGKLAVEVTAKPTPPAPPNMDAFTDDELRAIIRVGQALAEDESKDRLAIASARSGVNLDILTE